MEGFDLTKSIFAGLTPVQLQTALANAQQAMLDLSTGNKPVTVTYAQGDGTKTVTFTQTSKQALTALILELQAALGMRRRARRALGVLFR